MKPLFSSLYCPRECDRAPEVETVDWDDMKTPAFPFCCNAPMALFKYAGADMYHCWGCGKVASP